MSYDVMLEQSYPFPPELVWRALTERAALAEWLMPNDFEPRIGHKFQFRSKPIPGWRGFVECEVIEVVVARRLAYTWVGDADWQEPAVVRWTLKPIESGTLLCLAHTNLQEPWGRELQAMLSQGWKKMLEEMMIRAIERLRSQAQAAPARCEKKE